MPVDGHVTATQRRSAVETLLIVYAVDCECIGQHSMASALRMCADSLQQARRDELRPQIQIAPTWRERWACWLGGLVS